MSKMEFPHASQMLGVMFNQDAYEWVGELDIDAIVRHVAPMHSREWRLNAILELNALVSGSYSEIQLGEFAAASGVEVGWEGVTNKEWITEVRQVLRSIT